MSLRTVYLIIILFVPIFDVIAQNGTVETYGIQRSENPYPWLVGIEFQGDDDTTVILGCTGALINRRHVVSNAECFTVNGVAKSVRFGPIISLSGRTCPRENYANCIDDGATRIAISRVIPHPKFNASTDWFYSGASYHDIALVRLRDTVAYTDIIQPIRLPSGDITRSDAANREVHLAGYYYDVPDNYVRETKITYMDRQEYLKSGNERLIAADQIYVEVLYESKIPPCMLIGGLLVNKRGDSYELVGLLEYVSGCLNDKLFTNFFLYLEWIRSVTPDWLPCGRRRVDHVELIVNGEATKAGDWPWHVALYRLSKFKNSYICGGTLISKTMVLTAAHCVTISGIPVPSNIISVFLGKYYLNGPNVESQKKKVHSVIAHEDFSPNNYLENDIALLKLQTEAFYSDYVQPACIWYDEVFDRLPDSEIFGTVVGWGFDELDAISSQLKQANLPKVSDVTCTQKNPLFYSNVLSNNKKFCAGWANGTSPCNGDSGGGFLVFVPDKAKANSVVAGSWYVRGIVSMTASLKNFARCDPFQYVVFTDVNKYTDWIQRHLNAESKSLSN